MYFQLPLQSVQGFLHAAFVEQHRLGGLSPKLREKIKANTLIALKNTSSSMVSLFVGFSTEPEAASPHAVELLPNEARELSASELGWSTTHTYLTAHNPHDQTATLSVMAKW